MRSKITIIPTTPVLVSHPITPSNDYFVFILPAKSGTACERYKLSVLAPANRFGRRYQNNIP